MQSMNQEWGNLSESLIFIKERNLSPNLALLDVGCFTGSLIAHLSKSGWTDVHGVDVDRKAVDRGRRLYPELGTRIIPCSGCDLPFPTESFDVVAMFDVLERISGIEEFLSTEVW